MIKFWGITFCIVIHSNFPGGTGADQKSNGEEGSGESSKDDDGNKSLQDCKRKLKEQGKQIKELEKELEEIRETEDRSSDQIVLRMTRSQLESFGGQIKELLSSPE